MGIKKDLTGHRFGRLTVMKDVGVVKQRYYSWECLCDCGNIVIVNGSNLRRGFTKSCGCLAIDKATKHGMCGTITYNCWSGIIKRCNNPKATNYKNYGGRGIKVCDRWLKFENFLEDMGEKPENLTIERSDNKLGYCKENCCYASHTVQARNKRLDKNNKTGAPGVCWEKNSQKYRVLIGIDGKRLHIGRFAKLSDAVIARKQAELKYWNNNHKQTKFNQQSF